MEELKENVFVHGAKTPPKKVAPKLSKMSWLGIGFIIVSLGGYYFGLVKGEGEAGAFFFVNYGLVILHIFIRVINAYESTRWRLWKHPLNERVFTHTLFLVSCFALNEEMRVFSEFPVWMMVYVILVQLALVVKSQPFELSALFDGLLIFLIGTGMVLHGYMAFYLLPIYPLSAIALFVLGISFHSFVPLINFSLLLMVGKASIRKNPYLRTPFVLGITFPIVILIWFLSSMGIIHKEVHTLKKDYLLSEQALPEWLYIDQHITKNPWSTQAFDMHLDGISRGSDFFWVGVNADKEHNPLVLISKLFLGQLDLDKDAAELIVKSDYGNRHNFNRRLWRGTHLATGTIRTDVEVFPQHRLAYFQKTFTIENQNKRNWGRDEEALYTFHLPEGAIGTSLSLWINGREEQAALTTRSKADSAYHTIVGVERRDPALMHWQEGNRITVSVFPCPPKDTRKFKVGFTMPMRIDGDELVLDNITFQGPNSEDAMEAIKIHLSGNSAKDFRLHTGFHQDEDGAYVKEGSAKNDWIYRQPLTPISTAAFTWDGYAYQAFAPQIKLLPSQTRTVYLDIDHSWEMDFFEEIWENIHSLEVYAFDGGELVKMDYENQTSLFRKLRKKNYSLPALHLIPDPENSLIISKSNSFSPLLEDMEGIDFYLDMRDFLQKDLPKIKLLDLGETPSPYVQSLNELGCFQYFRGGADDLAKIIATNHFPQVALAAHDTYIPQAQLAIRKSAADGNTASNAPDHLMRFHAYGQLMKNLRASYFDKNAVSEAQIALAKEAYVVSPFSSLVSLESQEDYDRFDIDNSKNGLGNAAISNAGAVPEPHEWALIIVGIGFLGFMIWRKKFLLT